MLTPFWTEAFHEMLYLLFIYYKNTIVLGRLSCDWMFTGHFPFIMAGRKESKRKCMYYYHKLYKISGSEIANFFIAIIKLLSNGDAIQNPRHWHSCITLSTVYCMYMCVWMLTQFYNTARLTSSQPTPIHSRTSICSSIFINKSKLIWLHNHCILHDRWAMNRK